MWYDISTKLKDIKFEYNTLTGVVYPNLMSFLLCQQLDKFVGKDARIERREAHIKGFSTGLTH